MPQSTRPSKGQQGALLRYTSMASQMAITIFLGVWLGIKADEHWPLGIPIFTLIGSLAGVVMAVYVVIRDVLKNR
jgi:F0F1-type ATP synthase assembly protein I